ncbi:MAG: hypothetical protein NTY15_11695 [Planctomycetota bacterium]|nr:hypothetical protein [Planctomycetota bacterium]
MIPSYRVPGVLEQSANAPGVDPKAIELHKRMNGALELGDVISRALETVLRILTIEVQHA